MNAVLALAWARFSIITGIIGDIQGRVIIVLFYYTILVPFGLISRLFTDPLRTKTSHAAPGWLTRPPVGTTLEDAREQG